MEYHSDRIGLTDAAVRRLFSERVELGQTPSTMYAVFTRDGIVYGEGFGDAGGGRRPTLDTAYRIASCTKSFTAAALLIMVERGLLQLDDPVDRHLKVGPMIGPDGAPVPAPTLRHLVTMSAGLPTDDPWADRQESLSEKAFAELISAGIRFTARPGDRYEYSNLGFALLGAVIAAVSGRSYLDTVTAELITPLGLDGVGYDRRVSAPDGIAIGYHQIDDSWQPQPFSAPGAFSPIGGVFATPRALTRWIGWLSSAFTTTDDHDQPLGRLSRRLMQSVQVPFERQSAGTAGARRGYGMGLVVDDDHRHGLIAAHSGGYPGYGAHMRWHAHSGIGVLAFENGRYSAPIGPVTQALQLILDETARPDREPELWPETVAARLAVERLLRSWDDRVAAELFADNVDLDDPLPRRRRMITELAAEVGLDDQPLPLLDASPSSRTPAQLSWTMPGRRGSLRCEISLTPQQPPKVQTLRVRRG